MAARQIAFLRTNRFDAQAEAQVESLSRVRDLDVVVCADERHGIVDTGHWPKISMTAESLSRLNLHHHRRAGWQCGDYFYYHVLAARSDYNFYWMVEPDVLIDFPDVSEVFALFDRARHDLIAPKFGHRPQSWGWHTAMQEDGQPVFGTSVQFIRLSARAVAALHRVRAKASSAPGDKVWNAWPNDESFVATTLARLGFECADINAFSEVPLWHRDTFRNLSPWLLEERQKQRGSRRLYHPVLSRDAYLAKLRWFYGRGRLPTPDQRTTLLEYFGAEILEEFSAYGHSPAARFASHRTTGWSGRKE